jgi:3-methyladenine DNA glycosylase Tag
MIITDKTRCGWCHSSDLYMKYHDEEWGVPVYDDTTLFEFSPPFKQAKLDNYLEQRKFQSCF